MAVASLNIAGNDVGFTQGFLQPTLGAPFIINTQEAFDEKYGFKCFPNPVSDFLTVETSYQDFTEVQFINMDGQIVRLARFDYTPIDCALLPKGIYAVRLYSENKPESKTFKLIKQ